MSGRFRGVVSTRGSDAGQSWRRDFGTSVAVLKKEQAETEGVCF
jgi:hypothetical protein